MLYYNVDFNSTIGDPSKLISVQYNAAALMTAGSLSTIYTSGTPSYIDLNKPSAYLGLKFSIGTDHYQVYVRTHLYLSTCGGGKTVTFSV